MSHAELELSETKNMASMDSLDEKIPTPPNFKTIKQIDELDSESIRRQVFVNVIGFIRDFQVPRPTGGTDSKCTLTIVDHSVKDQIHGIAVNIFWPMESMPVVTDGSCIVMVRNVKVQMHAGAVSLIANKWKTEIHIIPPAKIRPGERTLSSDWQVFSAAGKGTNPANSLESAYVGWMIRRLDELVLPSEIEFQNRVAQSGNGRAKFCLLKDAKPECFYDILGQVVKIFDTSDGLGHITVYFTDYTANSDFHNYAWGEGLAKSNSRDGDTYGYIKGTKKDGNEWLGPFGKLTIQLTLWDGHAKTVRDSVKLDDWLLLTNVKMAYGKVGGLLEGFLRGDRGAYEGKSQVKILRPPENPEDVDPRWKNAVIRKKDWQIKAEKQKRDLLGEAENSLAKRSSNDGESQKGNAKKRRKEKRAALDRKLIASEAKFTELDLNKNVKCNFQDQPISPITDILKPETFKAEDGCEYESPFTNRKYRANVRIVDYFPHRIEDFAVGRRSNEMDILSDYSGGESTDLEDERRLWRSGKGFAKNIWEWRFELLVEDADPKGGNDRVWLTVGNQAAQGLLALEEDATSLRGDSHLLGKLKEQLFKLWGDLEEQKSAQVSFQEAESKSKTVHSSPFDSVFSSPPAVKKPGAQPHADSDAEDEGLKIISATKSEQCALAQRSGNPAGFRDKEQSITEFSPNNKAFTCCIKQYGIEILEEDLNRASAGNEKRWQRKFGMFDTFII